MHKPRATSLNAVHDGRERGLAIFRQGTNGHGVLLVHGITGSPAEMKHVAKRLHRAGYTVYAPLLAGHGVDMATLRATRWEDWFDSVCESAQWLGERADRLYVAGVCVGGLLGLRLAYTTPRVHAVAVYSPVLDYDGWNSPYYYRLGRIGVPVAVALGISRFISLKERPPFGIKSDRIRGLLNAKDTGIRGTLPAFPVDTLWQNLRLFKDIRAILPRTTTPTLLIHARDDDVGGPKNPHYIARNIGGPCQIEWLHNSYHMIHVDQEYPAVAERTRAFFAEHL